MIDFPFPPRRHIANPELPSAKIVETWNLTGSEVLYISEKEHLAEIELLRELIEELGKTFTKLKKAIDHE